MESDHEALHFLDITVKKVQRKDRNSYIYHKPTDSRNYVPYNSVHPKHVLINIPYNTVIYRTGSTNWSLMKTIENQN